MGRSITTVEGESKMLRRNVFYGRSLNWVEPNRQKLLNKYLKFQINNRNNKDSSTI